MSILASLLLCKMDKANISQGHWVPILNKSGRFIEEIFKITLVFVLTDIFKLKIPVRKSSASNTCILIYYTIVCNFYLSPVH